jgi:hypothetical protein
MGTLELAGLTRDEAIAFAAACIASVEQPKQDALWAQAVVALESMAVRKLSVSMQPLTIVAGAETQVPAATSDRHHVVRARASPALGQGFAIQLGSQPIRELTEQLAGLGTDHNRAYEICHESDGYLERMRRALSAHTPPAPNWASAPAAISVAACALIGGWDEANEQDQAVVSEISGVAHDAFAHALTPFAAGEAPLCKKVGTVWKVVSRESALGLLESYLTAPQLQAFLKSSRVVLLDPDPRFELPPEERWLANVRGKSRKYSEPLREGLSRGLILLCQ